MLRPADTPSPAPSLKGPARGILTPSFRISFRGAQHNGEVPQGTSATPSARHQSLPSSVHTGLRIILPGIIHEITGFDALFRCRIASRTCWAVVLVNGVHAFSRAPFASDGGVIRALFAMFKAKTQENRGETRL